MLRKCRLCHRYALWRSPLAQSRLEPASVTKITFDAAGDAHVRVNVGSGGCTARRISKWSSRRCAAGAKHFADRIAKTSARRSLRKAR
jgi:hypothetical protein